MKEISSLQNPQVKHWIKLRKDSEYRQQSQTVFLEGKKLVEEAKDIVALISTDPNQSDAIVVTDIVFEKISGMKSPEGVAAEVKMPKKGSWTQLERLLVLDGINDPGNLGTLFRTAMALGWQGVFLLGECCDPFNEKALTASRGAALKLPFQRGSWNELEDLIQQFQLTPLVADLNGQSIDTIKNRGQIALVLGNEAHGPSPQTLKRCKPITIPIHNMESLNVAIAGGIMMYQLRIDL